MIYRRDEIGWWGYLLLAITAGALLMRRRWPLAMLVVVALSCAASPLAQPGFGYPMIPFAFALYTVASLQSPTHALIGYAVGVGATVSIRGSEHPRVFGFSTTFIGSFCRVANHTAEGVVRMVRRIKAKLVLRLRAEGFSARQIEAQGMSRHSVVTVFDAADREGVDYDDVAGLDDAEVYARLFPGRGEHESVHAQPDWEQVHRELAKSG